MATKSKTREAQYREILEDIGIRLEDCRVLAYQFPGRYGAIAFHFDAIREAASFLFFDVLDATATVVCAPEEVAAIDALAARHGGEKRTPNLR